MRGLSFYLTNERLTAKLTCSRSSSGEKGFSRKRTPGGGATANAGAASCEKYDLLIEKVPKGLFPLEIADSLAKIIGSETGEGAGSLLKSLSVRFPLRNVDSVEMPYKSVMSFNTPMTKSLDAYVHGSGCEDLQSIDWYISGQFSDDSTINATISSRLRNIIQLCELRGFDRWRIQNILQLLIEKAVLGSNARILAMRLDDRAYQDEKPIAIQVGDGRVRMSIYAASPREIPGFSNGSGQLQLKIGTDDSGAPLTFDISVNQKLTSAARQATEDTFLADTMRQAWTKAEAIGQRTVTCELVSHCPLRST